MPEKLKIQDTWVGGHALLTNKERWLLFAKKIKCRLWAVQKLYNSQRGGMDKRMIKARDRVENKPMCGSKLFIQSLYKNENKSQEISLKTLRIPLQ